MSFYKDKRYVYTQDATITLQVEFSDDYVIGNEEGERTIVSSEMKDELPKLLGYEPVFYK